jgi:hypothetical protein
MLNRLWLGAREIGADNIWMKKPVLPGLVPGAWKSLTSLPAYETSRLRGTRAPLPVVATPDSAVATAVASAS